MELKEWRRALPKNVSDKANNGNVFFSSEYSDYVEKQGGIMLYVYDDCFLMPVHVEKRAGICFATCHSEPLVMSDNGNYGLFLNEACNCLKKYGITWVISAASALFEYYPEKSLRIPFGSHILDLSMSEEELFAVMHSKHRNCVRRAEKSEVEVRYGGIELLDDYIELDKATWKRSGRDTYGFDYFRDMLETMGKSIILYVAYKGGIPQAGACFYRNKAMSYYMFGCSADNPETGAANLLHWRAICDMKAEGVEKYSFVGCRINESEDSKYHSIQRFKERFGGELVKGYMFKAVLSPFKYKLFALLYRLKNKIKLVDAVDQEVEKWKELNQE